MPRFLVFDVFVQGWLTIEKVPQEQAAVSRALREQIMQPANFCVFVVCHGKISMIICFAFARLHAGES